MEAKLVKLIKFYGTKVDIHSEVDSDYNRGLRLAYAIAKQMTERIVFDILDKELTDNLLPDADNDECV